MSRGGLKGRTPFTKAQQGNRAFEHRYSSAYAGGGAGATRPEASARQQPCVSHIKRPMPDAPPATVPALLLPCHPFPFASPAQRCTYSWAFSPRLRVAFLASSSWPCTAGPYHQSSLLLSCRPCLCFAHVLFGRLISACIHAYSKFGPRAVPVMKGNKLGATRIPSHRTSLLSLS